MRDATTLYLMEHSLTAGDGTPAEQMNGWTPVPLTSEGRQLAMKAAGWLRDNANIGETYSSDLHRAVQTAGIIHDALGITKPNTERRGLRPFDVGLLEGERKEDVEGVLADLYARRWAKAPGSTQSVGKWLGVWGQELHRTIQEALGEEYDCLYVTHSLNLGAVPYLLSGGVAPLEQSSPVGATGILRLHVSDKGGHIAVEKAYTPTDVGE